MDRKIYLYTNQILSMLQGNYEPPVTCEIDPTNACQLNCSFCMYKKFRKEQKSELSVKLFDSILSQLLTMGVKSITFTGGGEPLVHPEAIGFIDRTIKTGLDVGMITNGIALNEVPDYLKKKMKFVRVSLDAASTGTYKKIKRVDKYEHVLGNISDFVSSCKNRTTIGISFVLCHTNDHEQHEAEKLARELDVDYIQFKPAWDNGNVYTPSYTEEVGSKVYVMERYKAKDTVPCKIAGLVGIIAANGKSYYCCQHRGEIQYELGDLNVHSFSDIWKRRKYVFPAISKCPRCRYMNYAKKFKEIPQMLIEHRSFL